MTCILVVLLGTSVILISADPAPFGTLLGTTDCNVQVFSSNYESINRSEYPDQESLVSFYHGEFTGYKYQCVELARRYWLLNFGVVFESIPMAYDIFPLRTARVVATNGSVPLQQFLNGCKSMPAKGSLLVWEAKGETFKVTGHVAVVVDASPDHVDIAEQNVLDEVWKGTTYSRRLPATLDPVSGSYTISCTFDESNILGWLTIGDSPATKCLDHSSVSVKGRHDHDRVRHWLDETDAAVKTWVAYYEERIAATRGANE